MAAVLLFACVAFLLEGFWSIPVASSLSVKLGLFPALTALGLFGWRSALLVGLFASTGRLWAGDELISACLPLVETAFAALLLVRRIPVALGVAVFWLLVGGPLSYLIHAALWSGPPHLPVAHVALAAASAVFCAALAEVALQLASETLRRERVSLMRDVPLSRQGLSVALSLTVIPTLGVSAIILDQSVNELGTNIRDRLERRALDYASLAELYLSNHRDAIELLAARHGDASSTSLFEDLDQVQRTIPGFRTMIAIDPQGQIRHGAPRARFEGLLRDLPPEQLNVSDRGYFIRARDSLRAYISDGFVGRGFGSDPIVAVSAPIVDATGAFAGVVEGSLNLPRFGEVGDVGSDEVLMVVTDQGGRVVAVSATGENGEPFLEFLSKQTLRASSVHEVVDVPVLSVEEERFFIADAPMLAGWRVSALLPVSVVIEPLGRFLQGFAIALVALAAMGAIVSEAFVAGITRSLQSLLTQVRDENGSHISLPLWQRGSPEVAQMESVLNDARQLSLNFRERVRGEIAEKTRQLREANHTLEALVVKDALTGINNRRGLEVGLEAKLEIAIRERLVLTVAMVDIDFFKRVNDLYGHAAGDDCLRQLANRLSRSFRRRGDLVARYGGEEFTVVTVSAFGDSHAARLEQFRREVDTAVFEDIGDGLTFTVSIGVVSKVPLNEDSVHSLLESADRALYESKAKGRNCVTTYTSVFAA